MAELGRIGTLPDDEIDLAEAALLLGALDDAMDRLERCRWHLKDLAGRAQALAVAAATARERGQVLSRILYEEAAMRATAIATIIPITPISSASSNGGAGCPSRWGFSISISAGGSAGTCAALICRDIS
jgi:phage-related tail protein